MSVSTFFLVLALATCDHKVRCHHGVVVADYGSACHWCGGDGLVQLVDILVPMADLAALKAIKPRVTVLVQADSVMKWR